MSRSDEVVVPFATFLEARERRRRVSAAFKQPLAGEIPEDGRPAAAVTVAPAREAISAVAPGGVHAEAAITGWTPPESPHRGSH